MAGSRNLYVLLAMSLLVNAFCAPTTKLYKWQRGATDNEVDSPLKRNAISSDESKDQDSTTHKTTYYSPPSTTKIDKFHDDDDDDDFNEPTSTAPPSGGSNIFSLIRLASALVPGLSGDDNNNGKYNLKPIIQKLINELKINKRRSVIQRRKDIQDNEIDIDYTVDLKPPPFQRQESDEGSDHESSETEEDSESDDGAEVESTENASTNNGESNSEVESTENASTSNRESNSKQDSESNGDDSEDYDSNEPPEGDGQGGGVLGILASLSGGDGQSDLGSLLAAVSGIVVNLSGDGLDLNSIIASGLGLFVGLLSEGEENPGAVIASYLLTSLDTITGGGAKNNGAFFGNLISKLLKGTSAAGDPEGSAEEDENKPPMADSAGFIVSLLMSILGDMSKTSSSGSSQPW